MAQIGPYIAYAALPDDKGVGLIELLSGTPLRILERPERSIISVIGEPTGRRFVTVERSQEDPAVQSVLEFGQDAPPPRFDFQIYVWNPEQLDRPIAKLPWRLVTDDRGAGLPRRGGEPPPLAAISPDGKTVAVATFRGNTVKLYWALMAARSCGTSERGTEGLRLRRGRTFGNCSGPE